MKRFAFMVLFICSILFCVECESANIRSDAKRFLSPPHGSARRDPRTYILDFLSYKVYTPGFRVRMTGQKSSALRCTGLHPDALRCSALQAQIL
jgi:hypothetical protein